MQRFREFLNQRWVALSLFFMLGGLSVYAYQHFLLQSPIPEITEVRANDHAYRFINPLLYYKSSPDAGLGSLQKKLFNFVETQKKLGNAQNISVYYRDMNTGEWTGINENEPFEPASMLKVTMLIAYLNQADTDPSILQKYLPYQPTNNIDETYRVEHYPKAGYYTVRELLEYMILYSDNDALDALSKNDGGGTAEVFTLFQLPTPSATSTTSDYMSARQYSRIFRVLYDSTFLSRESSEKALSLLSNTNFSQGIVAGVPREVTVSHKFGERTDARIAGAEVRELHDCGIIYKPNKPYFLCVMTRGSDFSKLQTIIANISRETYQQSP